MVAFDPPRLFEMKEAPGSGQQPFQVRCEFTALGDSGTKLDFLMVIEGVPAVFAGPVRRRLSGEIRGQFERFGELLAMR